MEHVDVPIQDGVVLLRVHRPQYAGELREGLHQFAQDALPGFHVLVAHRQEHHAFPGGCAELQRAQEAHMCALVVEAEAMYPCMGAEEVADGIARRRL